MGQDLTIAMKLVGDATSASKAVNQVNKDLSGITNVAGKVNSALGGIAKTAAGFAIGQGLFQLPGLLMDAGKAAADDAAATARLQQSIRNLGGDYDAINVKVNAAIASGQSLAFTDDQVRDSFQSLAAATGSADEALSRQRLAMDLSRGAGISLEAATRMVGRVNEENVEAFRRMGIVIGENATEADALAAVQAKFAGQADVYAQSTAGQFEQAQIAMSETVEALGAAVLPGFAAVGKVLAENLPAIQEFVGDLASGIGERVIPVIEDLTPLIQEAGDLINDPLLPAAIALFDAMLNVTSSVVSATSAAAAFLAPLRENDAAMAALTVVVTAATVAWGLMTAASIAHAVATGAMTLATNVMAAAQAALNLVMSANPIGLVVVAVAALTAGLVYLYHNNEDVRKAVDGLWAAFNTHLLPVLQDVWEWVKQVAQVVGPVLGAALSAAIGQVQSLWQGFQQVVGAIQGAITWVRNMATALSSLSIPDWLTPGSPTPLEVGLWGIEAAFRGNVDAARAFGIELETVGKKAEAAYDKIASGADYAATAWGNVMSGRGGGGGDGGDIMASLKAAQSSHPYAAAARAFEMFGYGYNPAQDKKRGYKDSSGKNRAGGISAFNVVLNRIGQLIGTKQASNVMEAWQMAAEWAMQRYGSGGGFFRLPGQSPVRIKGTAANPVWGNPSGGGGTDLMAIWGGSFAGGGGFTIPGVGGRDSRLALMRVTPGERVTVSTPGQAAGGMTIVVNVAGSVVTERNIVDAVHEGLLRKQRHGGRLGFSS